MGANEELTHKLPENRVPKVNSFPEQEERRPKAEEDRKNLEDSSTPEAEGGRNMESL